MKSEEKDDLVYKIIKTVIITACITAILTFYITVNVLTSNNVFLSGKKLSTDSEQSLENISDTLVGFRKLIDENYRGDIDEGKMLDETIKGFVNGLGDEYSQYMTAEEWEEYQVSALGNYVGIGVYMAEDTNGNVIVVKAVEGSPAESAGIKSGDIFVEINGENVVGCKSSEISEKVKGEEGTTVNLKLLRDSEYITFDVERKAINLYKVSDKMLENNIGYIDLPIFNDGCSEEFKTAFEELKSQGAEKLIIDLRNNTGGVVDEALDIADMIVEKDKTLLITVDSNNQKAVTKAKSDPIINMDIVVLVNEYSASASEILVGCLKDNGKATIIGKNTYGKGVIQTVYSLSDGSALKLTTAEYYTPNETKINKIGIAPDIEIDDVEQAKDEEQIDEQLNCAIEKLK